MIDTHSHLNFPELRQDLASVLSRAGEVGVEKIVVPSTNTEDSAEAVALAQAEPMIYAAIGIHPLHAYEYNEKDRGSLHELLLKKSRVVSMGEVGLDYYHFEESDPVEAIEAKKRVQQNVFLEMVSLAKEHQLPLIIHSREAFDDTKNILAQEAYNHPTVIHCFTGSSEQAAAWMEQGCHISLTGIITYKKNEALREMVKDLPLDRLMIETDAPYLPPEGRRGKTCEPADVRAVAECIAQVKGVSFEEVDEITTATAKAFFKV